MGFSSGAQEVAKVSHRDPEQCHQLWEDPEVTGVLNGKILYTWGDFPANHDYWRGCQIWVAERELRKRPNSVEFSKIHLPSSE